MKKQPKNFSTFFYSEATKIQNKGIQTLLLLLIFFVSIQRVSKLKECSSIIKHSQSIAVSGYQIKRCGVNWFGLLKSIFKSKDVGKQKDLCLPSTSNPVIDTSDFQKNNYFKISFMSGNCSVE